MAHTKESIRRMLATRKKRQQEKEAQIRAEAIVAHDRQNPRAEVVEVTTERIPLDIPEFIQRARVIDGDDLTDAQIDKLARLLVAVVRSI